MEMRSCSHARLPYLSNLISPAYRRAGGHGNPAAMGIEGGVASLMSHNAIPAIAAAIPYGGDSAVSEAAYFRSNVRRQIHSVVKPFLPLRRMLPIAEI